MPSSFGLWVSQCEFFNQGFLLYDFQKNYFSHFLRHQRGIPKEDFNHWFLLENLTIATVNIFGGQDLHSSIWTFMNFLLLRYTLSFLQHSTVPFSKYMKKSLGTYFEQSPAYRKNGTQLFQQLGDTQKSQVFLKRKKLFGGPPLTFQKRS
jgi:hypothetical protein